MEVLIDVEPTWRLLTSPDNIGEEEEEEEDLHHDNINCDLHTFNLRVDMNR